MEIEIDFEELDKLPIEKYNKLEEKFLKLLTKFIISAEDNYCKKKKLTRKQVLNDYNLYKKMRTAINERKSIKKASKTLMRFNKLLRPFVK